MNVSIYEHQYTIFNMGNKFITLAEMPVVCWHNQTANKLLCSHDDRACVEIFLCVC